MKVETTIKYSSVLLLCSAVILAYADPSAQRPNTGTSSCDSACYDCTPVGSVAVECKNRGFLKAAHGNPKNGLKKSETGCCERWFGSSCDFLTNDEVNCDQLPIADPHDEPEPES